MDKFTDVLVSLEKEGYDFSVFVKERNRCGENGIVKFSYAYVTPAAEQIMPLSVWELVEDESIFKPDVQPKRGSTDYKVTKLPLNSQAYLEEYLDEAFRFLRQVPCKSIAKVWIKVIEPRKKTRHPYIKGDLTKPEWWPRCVQHREPDHLQKEDRLRLMSTIILEVLPDLRNSEILDELYQDTLALGLFKNQPQKELIVKSIFDISRALCKSVTAEFVEVLDLTAFVPKSRAAEIKGCQKLMTPIQRESGVCLKQLIDHPELKLEHIDNFASPNLTDMLITSGPSFLELLDHPTGEISYDVEQSPVNKRLGGVF